MKVTWGLFGLLLSVVTFGSASCGGNPEIPTRGEETNVAGSGNGGGGRTGRVVELPGAGEGGDIGAGGGTGVPSCGVTNCGVGQRCDEDTDGNAVCLDNTCDDLACTELTECQPAPGGGFYCKSITCETDVECPLSRFCDGEKCVDDSCEPDTRRCDGDGVFVCASNGGGEDAPYVCGSAGYFTSTCNDADPSSTGCTCQDDWDCPEFTACETGLCKGTGFAPTCTLPPVPFQDVLPELEFRWGGQNSGNQNATGKAFPWSSQVLSTPMVANLDDDNGDGNVDELDFPELVFMTYPPTGGNPGNFRGVLRAVHAGGPNKGEDFFATCGAPAAPATPAPSYANANGAYWSEGAPVRTDCATDGDAESRADSLGRAAGALAVGDLDGDGFPEIVMPTTDFGGATSGIAIFTNRGELITSRTDLFPANGNTWDYAQPAIANVDFRGRLAEIVVGNRLVVLNRTNGTIGIDHVVTGNATAGGQTFNVTGEMGPTVCLADLRSDFVGLEIVAGPSLYRYNVNNATNLELVWDSSADLGLTNPDGFCAVADVLGADEMAAPGPDNPLDGVPEVVVISDGHLVILRARDGAVLRNLDLQGGNVGGAPNIDDFDGDGFPEIATALRDFYTVVDLQAPEPANCPAWPALLSPRGAPPGGNPARNPGGACRRDSDCNDGAVCNGITARCVCLHNDWRRDTEDDSSRATSSSIFDFNGDGAAEVIYNDECYFRVYDGATGGIYLALPSLSRTILENPVVADVDNDGNSEIVFVQNNEFFQCSETNLDSWPNGNNNVPQTSMPNGIAVYGDPTDTWVAARRIWNQHSYHVTNVTESGTLPSHEPESWRPLNGRLYNSYRAQPRNYGVAPDLALLAIQISSPDVTCGELSDEIQISVLVKNQGDLRVGPGVVIDFHGSFESPALEAPLEDMNGDPITVTLDKSLEPGASTIVTVTYQIGSTGRDDLPVEVRAVIDAAGAERECNEDNNEIAGPVDAGADLADLRIGIDAVTGCTPPSVEYTVTNDGALPAESVLVRFYAGDPSQGGQIIGEVSLDGPIGPGESLSDTLTLDPLTRDVTLYAVVDPLNTIDECNDANNLLEGPFLDCGIVR